MEAVGSGKACEESLDDYSSSLFQCCVCLDLLYKPIVLPCGHISCFWCVHRAMHNIQESHCAICRQSYRHFPSICELLHLLILKLEPAAYKRREKEVIEEEKQSRIESPQLIAHSEAESSGMDHDAKETATENGFNNNNSREKISINDVLCSACNELLYLPSVLNCGHVYCDSCMLSMAGEKIICKVCKSPHPGEFPNVCLDLNHFIEENFPKEYSLKKQNAIVKKSKCQPGALSSSPEEKSKTEKKKAEMNSCLNDQMYSVHIGVGCDFCGLYPIKGKRYKCVDCTEAVGFDLCEPCYKTDSKMPGRFNQQHTPDHKFEQDNSNLLSQILLSRAMNGDYDDGEDVEPLDVRNGIPDLGNGGEGHHHHDEDIL
ncbi:hypothetical protein LUZ60_014945 [Juncus effusus]|nr:hypothetical protein LUZ60_014945 [Juncus effusus]